MAFFGAEAFLDAAADLLTGLAFFAGDFFSTVFFGEAAFFAGDGAEALAGLAPTVAFTFLAGDFALAGDFRFGDAAGAAAAGAGAAWVVAGATGATAAFLAGDFLAADLAGDLAVFGLAVFGLAAFLAPSAPAAAAFLAGFLVFLAAPAGAEALAAATAAFLALALSFCACFFSSSLVLSPTLNTAVLKPCLSAPDLTPFLIARLPRVERALSSILYLFLN